jgi:hypothetical protein
MSEEIKPPKELEIVTDEQLHRKILSEQLNPISSKD